MSGKIKIRWLYICSYKSCKEGKQSVFLHEADLTEDKLAIWFGDEANGLSNLVLDQCDFCLTVEMPGNVESFNLASTTAMVLWEAVRQRKKR